MERGHFTDEQRHVLLQPIPTKRVSQDSQGHSAVEIHDVEAHLSRIFGFEGWDKEILYGGPHLIREKQGHDTDETKTGWYVVYRCNVRLTIYAPDGRVAAIREEGATGEASNQSQYAAAHDLAYKNAISYATKRCAKTLGDQYGLGLYANGSTDPLVRALVTAGMSWTELFALARDEVGADPRDAA